MLQFNKKESAKFDRSKLVKPLGKNVLLVPHLEYGFKVCWDDPWSFEYEQKKGDSAWHPSGDCLPSASSLYAKATEASGPRVMQSQKHFIIGHYWHQVIQYMMVKLELVDESCIERVAEKHWGTSRSDVPEPFHWVRGSGDIVPYEAKGWKGLVDIKTMGSYGYNQPGLPAAFADKYICQVNIYMDLFDQEQAMFLCVNKDTGDMREITFVRDQRLIDSIYDKWRFVSECIDQGLCPTEEDDEEFTVEVSVTSV